MNKSSQKSKVILGIILFVLGLIGILSILTMEIPLPEEVELLLKEKFSTLQIKFLLLINPIIMLIVAVILGTILHDKVNLRVPIIENAINKENTDLNLYELIKNGIIGGIIAGILLVSISYILYPFLPEEFLVLGEKFKPSLAGRFLYGGFSEEIIMRFGLMTLIVWLFAKIVKKKTQVIYWLGIFIAAILFAVGHFPIAFQAVGNPSPTLLTYILLGNSIGGIVFGWLYWKKGLESAFIAHIITHVILVATAPILN